MINPLTYQVEFARGIIHGHPTVPAATVTAICLAAITVLGLASTKQMRRLSFEG